MPKRTDIQRILILGAGPIVIGQACEFDYSGAQACKALREEGYYVILVNSNPATIMTDPELAHSTYIEPITPEIVEKIIRQEKPDAILPTMGGQTALNCALALSAQGILKKYNVQLIGASEEAIAKAEDREQFRIAMQKIGLAVPSSAVASSLEQALSIQAELGYPTIIRPSFTMGGSGGGIAYNREEFIEICSRGFDLSPTHELLIEESVLGWKEFEMEVVRDKADNCIIVCSIENFDPMGIHTGDSITVAPAQTLTDKEYQWMRNASMAILREIGVETGGSNVQFGVCPHTGRMVVIEMNPRVSRSSALASKATGFPIAKIAAKLAVGFTLDELQNDMTGGLTPASFEPTIDYVVTKIPRFNFEKFPQADQRLTTQMKSVGEAMAIGRTFQESLQKAMRSLEIGVNGFDEKIAKEDYNRDTFSAKLSAATPDRLWHIADAFRAGMTFEDIMQWSKVDPWFLGQIEEIIDAEQQMVKGGFARMDKNSLWQFKRRGFSDKRMAKLLGVSEESMRKKRLLLGVRPVYKRVDTCAAEFSTQTAYLYSTYDETTEADTNAREKVLVLGGGPNRIGQGIEFDYCCVHAALAIRELGYETIMVNCNPETVSTDYDTSDRLYFEPLTLEDVLEIISIEQPIGVIVQFGGQTPLKLAYELESAGVNILGTSPDAIDRAENRERFTKVIDHLGLRQPPNRTAISVEEGVRLASQLGYPLMVRPSYVLGGRAMEVVYNEVELRTYMTDAVQVSHRSPVLLDRSLNDAIEVDVDAVCDGKDVIIAGIMEHIEQAGVHSGDSTCCLPPHSLPLELREQLMVQMKQMALELGVIGLINAQFAIQNGVIYVLEVNPRASRTVPFVSKATQVPFAKIAAKAMLGVSLEAQNVRGMLLDDIMHDHFAVKVSVFPFGKFLGVDPILGPEMKSTGEVMGFGKTFAHAFSRAQLAAGVSFKRGGTLLVSVREADKARAIPIVSTFIEQGFRVVATSGTAAVLQAAGVACEKVNKVLEGRPHLVDMIKNDEIDFIINTTEGRQATADSYTIRRSALQHRVNYATTLAGAWAAAEVLKSQADDDLIHSLQTGFNQQ